MSIKDLIIRLRIEEDSRGFKKKGAHNPNEAKANLIEHGQGSKFKKTNNKGVKSGFLFIHVACIIGITKTNHLKSVGTSICQHETLGALKIYWQEIHKVLKE